MFICQIKTEIRPFKSDEFVDSMRWFLKSIRNEKDCLGYSIYQDSDKKNTYSLVGQWKKRQAMEKHFQTPEFEFLIGAARVLGEKFAMSIAEVSQTGGFELVKELIASQNRRSKTRIEQSPEP